MQLIRLGFGFRSAVFTTKHYGMWHAENHVLCILELQYDQWLKKLQLLPCLHKDYTAIHKHGDTQLATPWIRIADIINPS